MELKINEHILKASVNANIPQGLELGKRYLMNIALDVVEIADKDNQNGSINRVYKTKNSGEITLLDEGKNIIKAKDKGSMSKKLHGAFYFLSQEEGEDFETFYQTNMKKLINYLPEIYQYIRNKS